MNLKVLLTSPTAKAPSKAYPTDTGYDLFVDQDVTLNDSPIACTTGVKLVIPKGYWVRFAEKSGKALKGIQIHGGIIDETYRGELKVIASCNGSGFRLKTGEAVCQMILEKRNDADIEIITEDQLTETDRGTNGFGSSGR